MKLLFAILFLFVLNIPAKAVELTPTPDAKTTEIVNIVKQIVSESITPTPIVSDKPKSFYGNITKIENNTITIVYKNKTQLIEVNDETVYIDLKRNKSKFSNFKAGQEILAMGYLNEENILNGKRILATEQKSVVNNHQTVTGQIVDISKETSIFTLTPNYNKNSPFQLKTDSKTKIVDTDNKTILSSSVIVNGKKIIAIIQPDSKLENTFYTTKIINLDSTTKISSSNSTVKP